MQRLEVSGAVQLVYRSLGVKGLSTLPSRAAVGVITLDSGRWSNLNLKLHEPSLCAT